MAFTVISHSEYKTDLYNGREFFLSQELRLKILPTNVGWHRAACTIL